MPEFCKVVVNSPLPNPLTYKIPDDLDEKLRPGDLLEVPLRNRVAQGLLLEVGSDIGELGVKESSIKEIVRRVETSVKISETELKLFTWMSRYYHYPLGKLVFDVLPKILKRPRKLNFVSGKEVGDSFVLNQAQEQIWNSLEPLLSQGFGSSLIHGITGSGKSVLYLKAIKDTLKRGKSVFFVLPEINLTPQFLSFFEEHLPCDIYSFHSSISNSDKYGLWTLLQECEKPKLIIGVRSSIFLPLRNCGLIILDEEHDSSYKQNDRCPYHVREVAYTKSKLNNSFLLMGSATPSLESYQFYKHKNPERYFALSERANELPLPIISLVDERLGGEEYESVENIWPLQKSILEKTKKALDSGEQVLFFLNRLGFYQFIQCRGCGHQFECKNCSTVLRFFKERKILKCQHCEFSKPLPDECPECNCLTLSGKGYGTERVQEVLQNYFPEKKVGRFDRADLKNFSDLKVRLEEFNRGDLDILVGTQMLSKGHNFEKVNLVVILGVDSQLNYPDFRGREKVFQLLTQVSGRSGRFDKQGEVVIQTLSPENPLFKLVQENKIMQFFEEELEIRETFDSPPFGKMAILYFTGKRRNEVMGFVENLTQASRRLSTEHFPKVEVLGCRAASLEKRVNQFTWLIEVRSININDLHNFLNTLLQSFGIPSGISLNLDIDPQNIQ